MASFSFRTCKKVEESSEGGGEGGREGEQHNGARTPYIGLPDGRRTDGGRTRRTDNGNRNRSGGRLEAAGPTRREENGEAETAADKGTAEPSNPSNITSDIRNGDNDFRIQSHVFFGGLRKSTVWVV